MRISFALSSVVVVIGCQSPSFPFGGGDGDHVQSTVSMSVIANRNLDILFVIDDSPSMEDKQLALAAAFPQMIDVLGQLDGGLPDLHIGVVTSDMGTSAVSGIGNPIGTAGMGGCWDSGLGGSLQMTPAMTEAFLSDVAAPDGTRSRNYSGELRDAFSDLAQVGATGCGFEQHLSALEHALVNPSNVGFLRPEANLAVVFLADEDDCSAASPTLFAQEAPGLGSLQSFRCFRHGVRCAQSATTVGAKTGCLPDVDSELVRDPAEVVQALLAAKSDPRMIMVAGVVGDPSAVAVEMRRPPGGGADEAALAHACSFVGPDGASVADPAVRLASFLDAFPGQSTLTNVCGGDLTNPLNVIGLAAKKLMGDPCVDTTGLADTAAAAGVQPSCVAVEIRDSGPSVELEIPACTAGQSDCFELVADARQCPSTSEHLKLSVRRSIAPPTDTWVHLRCRSR